MKTNILILFLASCVFLLQSCECNDGEIVIPCSNKIDLGTFENEKDLPYSENETVEFENEIGEERRLFFNETFNVSVFLRGEDFPVTSHLTPCVETLSEDEISWKQERYFGLALIGLDDGVLIKELLAVDLEDLEAGVVGEYFTITVRNKGNGGFLGGSTLSFSENKIQTSQQSSYDFGYEFFETITLNGRAFENVVRALDTQSEEITQLYFSTKGELIAFEDVDDGVFVLRQ